MSSNLRQRIKERWKSIIFLLGGGVALVTPLFTAFDTLEARLIWILAICLVFLGAAFFVALRRISELKDEIEERDSYYNLIDEKFTLPVEIKEKNLFVEMNDGGDDIIRYENTIAATEGNQIDKFYALIGTNKKATWEDLDPDTEGATVVDHHRRDYEELTRFILTLEFHQLVSEDDSYDISYTVSHDVVDVDDDYAYQVIRHPTDEVKIGLTFPDGWEPVRAIASHDDDSESPSLPQPEKDLEDDNWKIEWNCSSCSIGERYEIDYLAEQRN